MGCVQEHPQEPGLEKRRSAKQQLTFGVSDFVHEMQGSINNEYQLIMPSLGKGSFGQVFKAIHRKTGLQRAVKTISKAKLKVSDQKFLQEEVENLKKLDHPNILKVYEFYQDKDFLYIVTQLCTGGQLLDRILQDKYFSEHTCGQILKQILCAISYCHNNGIVHRDLKPQNIIFESRLPDSMLKIIDFGAAREYRYEQSLNHKIGTPYYIAPEVLFADYNEKCDVWSCGVILYIMLSGLPPFSGRTDKDILMSVSKAAYTLRIPQFREVSAEAKDLLTKMLEKDKNKRLSAEECLNHPWLQKVTQGCRVSQTALLKTLDNITTFRTQSELQYVTWMYIVNILTTKEEKRQMYKIFSLLDQDNNGQISLEELINGFKSLTSQEHHLQAETKATNFYTKYCNRPITFNQFVMFSISRRCLLTDSNLQKIFRLFDKDESKAITVGQLKEILGSSKQVNLRVWQGLMKEADSNSDGSISIDEFKDMMKGMFMELTTRKKTQFY